MLLWILIVIHQLLTKGKGIHRGFGYAGAVLLLVGLGFSWGPLLSSKIPSLHHFGGVTLMEITLGVNVLGIAAEFLIALCKIGQGDIKGHRLGMMSVVVFTAGPGVYRYCVWLMTWALGLQGADASVLQTTWVHEFSLSAVILLVICMLMLPSFSGHKWELKKLDGGSGMKILSRLMCVLYIGLVLLYSGFLVSLAFMWPKLT